VMPKANVIRAGTVLEVKSSLCLIVSLPLLQRSVAVEVDRD
jgi:hypothetical protein